MLRILKKINDCGETLYEYQDNKSVQSYKSQFQIPCQNDPKSISFKDWQNQYETEIQMIIYDFFEFVVGKCKQYSLVCSFNENEIKEQLAQLIFKSSHNRFKTNRDIFSSKS